MNQFYHVSLYGQTPRRGAEPHEHARGIAREAARLPSACKHLDEPKDAVPLYGDSPEDAAALAVKRARKARDSVGRRLRRDGAAMAAIVVSYPVARVKVEACSEQTRTYHKWRDDTLNWLRREYGETLVSVVEHVDEEFPHLHGFAVPSLGADGRLQWSAMHAGRQAQAEAASRGAGASELRNVYIAAMRAQQDRFWEEVSKHYGHARVGPRRARLARAEAMRVAEAERAAAKLAAEAEAARNAAEEKAREEVQRIRTAAVAWAKKEKALVKTMVERERVSARNEIRSAREQMEVYKDRCSRLEEILIANGIDPDHILIHSL